MIAVSASTAATAAAAANGRDIRLSAARTEPTRQTAAGLTRLLVPVDGSEFALAALAAAIPLASRLGAEIALVQAATPVWVPGADRSSDLDLALQLGETDALGSLAQAAEEVRAAGVPVSETVVKGRAGIDPAHAIVTAAGKLRPGLIVMATHGRSGMQRVVLGSVAEEVVRTAPVPVLLIHPRAPGVAGAAESTDGAWSAQRRALHDRLRSQPLRLVVALDGSTESEASLGPVVALARATCAEVDLVQVVPEESILPVPEPELAAATQRARSYLQDVAHRLHAYGLSPKRVRVTIPPAVGISVSEALLRHATYRRASMLVLASHARRGIDRLLHGSVQTNVIARAALPVLVARATG